MAETAGLALAMSHAATAMGRRWSWSIGTVRGTSVRLHVTFLLFLAWIAATAWITAGPQAALNSTVIMVLLFLCVVLHEFGHIFAARRFGVRTPEVVLLPIGGVSRLERIPEEPRAEFVIAIAGPAVTLLITLALVLTLGGMPGPKALSEATGARAIAGQLAYINAALFVFNLLPAFPLDGGRVLRAGLSSWLGRVRGTRIAAAIGQGAALLLGLAGLVSGNIILLLIGIFVFLAAGSENGLAELGGITAGRPARDSMIDRFLSIPQGAPVSVAADALLRTEQKEFPVVDLGGRLVGVLTRDGMIRALVELGPDAPIGRTFLMDVPVVLPSTRMDEIVPLLASGAPVVAVTDEHEQFLGYITWENLMEKLLISRSIERNAERASHVAGHAARTR